MNTDLLYEQILLLPEDMQEQVANFVGSLIEKAEKEKSANNNKERAHGFFKGMIHMASDFDGPLEDFKDYM
ncbi:MAG: DUF2281 domain-containing protein [Bacteroidota bacterium]